jgi:hypothetical protein
VEGSEDLGRHIELLAPRQYARHMSRDHLFPAEAMPLIDTQLARGDWDFALRLAFQTIAAVAATPNGVLGSQEPVWCADERFNVLVATGVAWALERRGLPAPPWVERPPLAEAWIVWSDEHGPSEAWAIRIRARTPKRFADRRVFLTENDLS